MDLEKHQMKLDILALSSDHIEMAARLVDLQKRLAALESAALKKPFRRETED